MKAIFVLLPVTAVLSWGQATISSPQLGFVRDKTSQVRPVFGVAGNFTLGDSIGADVISTAFSGSIGFAKSDSSIAVFDKDGNVLYGMDAPPGAALFGFGIEHALVYFTKTGALWRWTGSTLDPVVLDTSLDLEGEVLSIAQPDAGHAAIAVRRDDGLWLIRVVLATGSIDSRQFLPGAAGAVYLLNDGGLVIATDEIVIRYSDGTEKHLPANLQGDVRMRQMGSGWMHVQDSSDQQFAICLQRGREQMYQLPEFQP